jgi:putative transposase
MARKPLIRSSTFPYHVTNRSNNKEWFYIPIEEVWRIFTNTLTLCTDRYQIIPYAFVLMSNHYHLIVATPLNNLDFMMRFFQTEVAKEIQRRAGRINHIFGNRYKWSLLWNATATAYGYKYVLRNPVRAGLSQSVECYPYSSINPKMIESVPWACGVSKKWSLVPRDYSEQLRWLNRQATANSENLVSRGLRRMEFKFPQGNADLRNLLALEAEYGIPTAPATFTAEKSIGTL